MVDAFKLASDQLREIAEASEGSIEISDERSCRDWRWFDVSIRFDGLKSVDGGLRVRARESFLVIVPATFPFRYPVVETPHIRFSGFRHVQWKRQLCLYASSADWDPADGMYGFIKRLDHWIRDAALNNLDPNDAPLHPPVAYRTVNRLFVPIADTPLVDGSPWFGVAELRDRHGRTEIIGWKKHGRHSDYFAPAILLHKNFPFEYPQTVEVLLKELESHGIEWVNFIIHLSVYARKSKMATPLTVVLGTPMRRIVTGGPALQHLAVWQISADDADKMRRLITSLQDEDTAHRSAIEAVCKWSVSATVGWCDVREKRPEVTRRRDHSSPMSWFLGKRVAIWGCGAIGTHVAESIVRAGAIAIELVDNKTVGPGVLVRQGFEDVDIGRYKAKALADRLKRINPDLETVPKAHDLIERISGISPFPSVDLIVDCTASLAVRTALERVLDDMDFRPSIASIAIDSRAAAALATLSTPGHSGCTLDLARKLKLEACRKSKLSRSLEAFWPKSASRESFQPEPGCSEPTFVGSNTDLAGQSARMLNAIARAVAEPVGGCTGAGWLAEESGPVHTFKWTADHVLKDDGRGYSVRVSSHAAQEMRGWARRAERTSGPAIETGGLVFGESNEAAGVLWVTDVDGPPSDSHAAEDHFICGTDGTENATKRRRCRFRQSVDCIGSWHTHPTSAPRPSCVDMSAVAQLLTSAGSDRRTLLVLILSLSDSPNDPTLGAYSFRTKLTRKHFIQPTVAATVRLGPQTKMPRNVGIALSGGGFRAIAFHLGCLRALHDLELLRRLQVISSVSGGSIISAMYAYSNDSFPEFDRRVVELLRRGLQRRIIREVYGYIFYNIARCVRRTVHRDGEHSIRTRSLWSFSLTEAFREVIAKSLFGETLVRQVARHPLHTVINATEMCTGSAFRFGSQQSGCWRLGSIPTEDAMVADAVAASAAYPFCFPSLERKYRFAKDGRTTRPQRVLLTDGGIFENLGVSPMEPGRVPEISTNVFDPDYIICCDAGAGLFDRATYPKHWFRRIRRSLGTSFRKLQDSTRKRLHDLDDAGRIQGFALCYLGQQDRSLPWIPSGLPRRAEVQDYPTDFSPMSAADIDRLALRGEYLMRFLISYYLSDLWNNFRVEPHDRQGLVD